MRLSVALALALLSGCAHAPDEVKPRDPPPPRRGRGKEAQVACISLGEALYGASSGRQVIERAQRSPRMHADDESLAELERCLRRPGMPAPAVRALAHGYAAAVVSARFPASEMERLLENDALPADIALFWSGRAHDDAGRREAALSSWRAALVENEGLSAARVATASTLASLGRHDEAARELALAPAGDRADLHAYVRAAALVERGARAEALASLAAPPPSSSVANGPDALALRMLPVVDVAPLWCALGRRQAREGDGGARASLRAGRCFDDIARAHLAAGDPFAAFVASLFASDPGVVEEARVAAGRPRRVGSSSRMRLALCQAAHSVESAEQCAALQAIVDEDARSADGGAAAARVRAASSYGPWRVRVVGEPTARGDALPDGDGLVEVLSGAYVAVARAEAAAGQLVVAGGPPAGGGAWRRYVAILDAAGGRLGPFDLGLDVKGDVLLPGGIEIVVEERELFVRGWRGRGADLVEPVELSASLDALLADGDGDGLTDVEEAFFATAPDERDTDGDARADGDDLLPLGPGGGDAVLDEVTRRALGLLVYGDEARLLGESERESDDDDVLFLGVPRPLLRERQGTLVIELVGDAADAWARLHGGAALAKVGDVVFDAAKERAFVEVAQGFRSGGYAVVERTADGWRARRLSAEMALSLAGD